MTGHSSSPGSALRGEIADAIREYCHSVSPTAVQMSHGVERIYYAGISLDGLTDAIFAALGAGVAQCAPDPIQDTWLVGGSDLKAMSGSVESDRVIQLHFRRTATDADRKWLLEAINAKIASDASPVSLTGSQAPAQGSEVTSAMINAGAQALANDVWHPPQQLMSLALYEQDKFRRQARIVLEAASPLPSTLRGPSEPLQCLRCGTIDAFGPVTSNHGASK
jgi:hypothetical protein